MIVSVSRSGLRQVQWHEYLIRFALGGLVTACAGLLAGKFGPSFGGLFLAFPALLVASATLVEKHERERFEGKGLQGQKRSTQAAGADTAGAAMGSLGLMAFASFVWKLLPGHSAWIVLPGATLVWAAIAAATWWLWKRDFPRKLRSMPARRLRTNRTEGEK